MEKRVGRMEMGKRKKRGKMKRRRRDAEKEEGECSGEMRAWDKIRRDMGVEEKWRVVGRR